MSHDFFLLLTMLTRQALCFLLVVFNLLYASHYMIHNYLKLMTVFLLEIVSLKEIICERNKDNQNTLH